MNARTQTKTTTQEQQKYSARTAVEEKKIEKEEQPKSLRRDTRIVVEASKFGAHPRKPQTAINLKNTNQVGSKNNKVGITSPIKKQNGSVNKNTKLGSSNVNPLRQGNLKTNTPALSNRVASSARVGPTGASGIHARLKKKSPWFDSIMTPIKGAGVKVPDAVGTDTGTYQHVENVSVPVLANGCSGLRIICPYINNFDFASGSPAAGPGSNYQTTTSTSSTANLWWGVSPTPGENAYPFARVPALMKATAQSHRIVSCSVLAQPEVSSLSDAGEMCAFVKPFSCNNSQVPYATLQSQWDSAIMPVNAHKPLMARWYPIKSDFQDFDTQSEQPPIYGEAPAIGYDDFIDPDQIFSVKDPDRGVIPWEIGVVCTGMTPNTGVVRFQIVVNYEFVPKTQTSMIESTPSPVDPTEESLVCNWVSNCPVTGVVSQKTASSAQEASTVSEDSDPTGMGMIFNVVEEILPFIKAGAKFLL